MIYRWFWLSLEFWIRGVSCTVVHQLWTNIEKSSVIEGSNQWFFLLPSDFSYFIVLRFNEGLQILILKILKISKNQLRDSKNFFNFDFRLLFWRYLLINRWTLQRLILKLVLENKLNLWRHDWLFACFFIFFTRCD